MGNSAGVLGSYEVKWEYKDMGENGKAIVEMRVTNTMSLQSGTCPPVIGYQDWWVNGRANQQSGRRRRSDAFGDNELQMADGDPGRCCSATGDAGASMSLRADHTFDVANLPNEIIASQFYTDQTNSGSGVWKKADGNSVEMTYRSITNLGDAGERLPLPVLTFTASSSSKSPRVFFVTDRAELVYYTFKRAPA